MSLLRCFLARRPATPPQAPRAPAPETDAGLDRPLACGWFDSSHDLSHGLRVTVHADDPGQVPGVPLSWWLAWELDAALTPVR